jgi:hypothetical protein
VAKHRQAATTSSIADLYAAGMIIGGAGLIMHSLAGILGPKPQPHGIVVGGVDLSHTDLSQPFFADFSVLPSATALVKQAAFRRLRYAFTELHRWQPMWLCRPETDFVTGRFMLYVVPVAATTREAEVATDPSAVEQWAAFNG